MTEYQCEYQLPEETQDTLCCKRYKAYWGWWTSLFLTISFLIFIGYMTVNYDLLHRSNHNCNNELLEVNNQKSVLESKLIGKVQDNIALSHDIRQLNQSLESEKDKLRVAHTQLEFYKKTLEQIKEKYASTLKQLKEANERWKASLDMPRLDIQKNINLTRPIDKNDINQLLDEIMTLKNLQEAEDCNGECINTSSNKTNNEWWRFWARSSTSKLLAGNQNCVIITCLLILVQMLK